jgi:hypothetical protein
MNRPSAPARTCRARPELASREDFEVANHSSGGPHTEHVSVGFKDPLCPVASLPERPLPGNFEQRLSDKEAPDWTIEKVDEAVANGAVTPPLPRSEQARAPIIEHVVVRVRRDAPSGLKHDRQGSWEVVGDGDLHLVSVDLLATGHQREGAMDDDPIAFDLDSEIGIGRCKLGDEPFGYRGSSSSCRLIHYGKVEA